MYAVCIPYSCYTHPLMELIACTTRRISLGEDLLSVLREKQKEDFHPQDILVVSSKAIATAEGRIIDLAALTVSDKAKAYAEECNRSPSFCQAVLDEVEFRNGTVVGTCPGALLTELKPKGLSEGTILTANAGLDESNASEGTAIGWPDDPVSSVRKLQKAASGERRAGSKLIAVILSDSCCRPRRLGVTAYALAVAGIDPLQNQKGKHDLFDRELRITQEAVADQLATAANMLMGNANASIPAVIIRDHKIPLSKYEGWVPGIAREEDLFSEVL